MVNPIDCGGHGSKVKVTMGIIDKCRMRGDVTLCIFIFLFRMLPIQGTSGLLTGLGSKTDL